MSVLAFDSRLDVSILCQAIENDEIDYEEYVEQNHRARTNRAGKKAAMQVSEQSTPQPELEPTPKKGRGRGRPSAKGASHEDSPIPTAAAKRKRVKEMSVTPSIVDDDEEEEKPTLVCPVSLQVPYD